MNVKELKEILENCDPDAEIRVLFPLTKRPFLGNLEPILNIEPIFDQDTNKTGYMIDTGIGASGRYEKYQKEKNGGS